MSAAGVVLVVLTSAALGQGLPPELERLFSSGVEAQKAGRLDEAESAFVEVVRRGGNRAFVFNNLGIVRQQKGEHERALAEFREASRMDPGYPAPRVLAGVSLLALGRTAEAVAELKDAVALDPRNSAARVELARASVRAGKLGAVVEQYRWLRDSNPAEPEYRYQLARMYANLAASVFRNMYAAHPKAARVQQILGENYLAQGRLPQAIAAFEDALRADPKLPGVHLNLAQVYLRQRDVASARRELDLELEVVPESAMARALKTKLASPGAATK